MQYKSTDMESSVFLTGGKVCCPVTLGSMSCNKKEQQFLSNSTRKKVNFGHAYAARSPQVRSFSEKFESGIFLPASVFRVLPDLSEDAES